MYRSLLLAALATLTVPASADILMPGTAPVAHRFEVRGLERLPEGTRLFAYPVGFGEEALELTEGRPFAFYKFCSPRIYACSGEFPQLEDPLAEPDLPASAFALERVHALPDTSATRAIHTVYELRGIEGDVVQLGVISEVRYDAEGREVGAAASRMDPRWLWLPGPGLLLLGALAVGRRRRVAVA